MINWIKGPPEWAEGRDVLIWVPGAVYHVRAHLDPYTGANWLPLCDENRVWINNDHDIKYHAFINEPEGG